MSLYPLLIDDEVRAKLAQLAALAEADPVPMARLRKLTRDPKDPLKVAHMAQMNAQSLDIPTCYCVTYSVEEQPFGLARHMSLSITTPGAKLPHPAAVWEVAQLLGFWGAIHSCEAIYPERLTQGEAINLVQRFERANVQ